MRICVTGGCGFIGHNVVSRFEQLGHHVEIIDTLTDYGIIPSEELSYLLIERGKKYNAKINSVCVSSPLIREVINNFRPELIIHLASFPRQKIVNANPQAGSRVMIEGLLNLLELSKEFNIKKFIYISSSMIYGNFSDNVIEDFSCNPQGPYGIMKFMGEKLVMDYGRKHNLKYTIIRPSAVYGPLDVEDRVISRFMLTALRGDTLIVNGANEKLDFTYVDDVADGITAASLTHCTDNKIYNITRSHSISLLDAAKLVIDIVGNGQINCREKDSNFPNRGSLNINAARQDFNFDPKVDIEEGFNRYHDWFLSSLYWRKQIDK